MPGSSECSLPEPSSYKAMSLWANPNFKNQKDRERLQMLVEKITSRQNPLVKRFRRVRTGGDRAFIFLEGVRLIEEAIHAGVRFDVVAFTSTLEAHDRGLSLIDHLRAVACRGANVSEQVMKSMTETETPQGIAAIVSRPFFALEGVFEGLTFIVIADGLQDPGNLGTLIRTAEAAGASAVITTRNTVDPFNQKALRASMGSTIRMPVATAARSKEVVALCETHGVRVMATRPRRESPDGTETSLYTDA